MDFELTKRQKQIRLAAREFAEGEFPEIAREYDRREEFPRELWKKACELGFIGLFIQKEYGGLGLGFLEFAMVMEEFWRVDPGCGDSYVINGSKQFITNGSIANYLAVFCLAHPEAESKLKRFGVIIVETDRPGFSALKITGKMGIRASDTAEIRLSDVRVPKEK